MDDNTNGHTKEQLLDAKLELIRQEQRAGFQRVEDKLDSHEKEVGDLQTRVRDLEIKMSESQTKLKLLMVLMSAGSGGIGAFLSKMF